MPVPLAILLVASLLTAASVRCFAQGAERLPDSISTREQWQQRVDEARRRSEEFVANARMHALPPTPSDLEEKEAADRALRDPSLQQGDIVATGKGFVVFLGREELHQPNDFMSVPDQQRPR
jgi:hypothetical protein